MHAAGALNFYVLLISSYGEGAFDGLQKETSGRIARNALLQLLRSFQACSALTRFCGSVDEVETRSYYSVKSPYILKLF